MAIENRAGSSIFPSFDDVDLDGRRVLLREDFNVPLDAQAEISSDARIQAALPSIRDALNRGAQVILASHLGSPPAGLSPAERANYSLRPVAVRLSELLACKVPLVEDWAQGGELSVPPEGVLLLENLRFHPGETSNDAALAKLLASLCDVYAMDAFGVTHRAHASTVGALEQARSVCAGPLLLAELEALNKAMENPRRPLVAVVGGAKISSKLTMLSALTQKADTVLVGGGTANTLMVAAGLDVGRSLCARDLLQDAASLLESGRILLPSDVVVADKMSVDAQVDTVLADKVGANRCIYDIGPETIANYRHVLNSAATVVWSGPLGVFELPPFASGTRDLAIALSESKAYSLAGGGDTLAALQHLGLERAVSYASTGGGATLGYIECGLELPALRALQARSEHLK